MDVLISTYDEYIKNYNDRLSSYKSEYIDRTEGSFLEKELTNYADYCKILINIANFFNSTANKKLTKNKLLDSYISYLRKINEPVYNEIFSTGTPLVDGDQEILENGIEYEMIRGYILPPSDIIFKKIDNLITSAKRIIAFIIEKQKQTNLIVEKKSYIDQVWFKVGVLLASGKMDNYYNTTSAGIMYLKDSYTAPMVAKELGNEKYHKDILATLKNYSPKNTNANKNIFNSRDKMLKIISHCEKNNIDVIPDFKKRLPSE